MAVGGQHARDVIGAKVGAGQGQPAQVGVQVAQATGLVGLRGALVQFEEPDPRGPEPQRPVVVASSADHHLAGAAGQCRGHRVVEEPCPRLMPGTERPENLAAYRPGRRLDETFAEMQQAYAAED